ncbi:MAG: hypothetical protein IPG50_04435 [Myxococcales bacterium]|nr:hypothetical protein [Myxococcales bacterium]
MGVLVAVEVASIQVACGSRSELGASDPSVDAATAIDARADITPTDGRHETSALDASVADARQSFDAPTPPDARAGRDADAAPDDAPATDATTIPPIDASLPDATAMRCVDGGSSAPYLVSDTGEFFRFDAANGSATLLTSLVCPAGPSAPWTMAVTSDAAYVLYTDWQLYRVDLRTFACSATNYVEGQLGFPANVGVATVGTLSGDRLLVYGLGSFDGGPSGAMLASSDLSSFELDPVAPIVPNPINYPVDIKSDAYGRLFAADASGLLLSVNASTGQILGRDETGIASGGSWALLVYEEQIYLFTGARGQVHRYDIATKQASQLGNTGHTIVGAGAAPCLR